MSARHTPPLGHLTGHGWRSQGHIKGLLQHLHARPHRRRRKASEVCRTGGHTLPSEASHGPFTCHSQDTICKGDLGYFQGYVFVRPKRTPSSPREQRRGYGASGLQGYGRVALWAIRRARIWATLRAKYRAKNRAIGRGHFQGHSMGYFQGHCLGADNHMVLRNRMLVAPSAYPYKNNIRIL